MPRPKFPHCFTIKYNQSVRVLTTGVKVSKAYDPTSGEPPPRKYNFNAIWDTGATNTVVTKNVVHALRIQPIRSITAHGVNGEHMTNVYVINLYLPNKVFIAGLSVTEGNLGNMDDLLIGMDIIGKGDFTVTNKDGLTIMNYSFPSILEFDFENQFPMTRQQRRAIQRKIAPFTI